MKASNANNAGLTCEIDSKEFELLDTLLSARLKPGPRRRTIVDLRDKFSSLRELIHAAPRSLKTATKFGAIAHEELQKLRKLAIALAKVEVTNTPVLSQYEEVINYCRTILAGEKRELFYVLLLNKAQKLVGTHCLQSGTIDHVSVYPRELFDLAMENSASSIILVHNHPGGNPKPSRADIAMTGIIASVGEHLGIKLVDHIIVASTGTYSFREKNMVETSAKATLVRKSPFVASRSRTTMKIPTGPLYRKGLHYDRT